MVVCELGLGVACAAAAWLPFAVHFCDCVWFIAVYGCVCLVGC